MLFHFVFIPVSFYRHRANETNVCFIFASLLHVLPFLFCLWSPWKRRFTRDRNQFYWFFFLLFSGRTHFCRIFTYLILTMFYECMAHVLQHHLYKLCAISRAKREQWLNCFSFNAHVSRPIAMQCIIFISDTSLSFITMKLSLSVRIYIHHEIESVLNLNGSTYGWKYHLVKHYKILVVEALELFLCHCCNLSVWFIYVSSGEGKRTARSNSKSCVLCPRMLQLWVNTKGHWIINTLCGTVVDFFLPLCLFISLSLPTIESVITFASDSLPLSLCVCVWNVVSFFSLFIAIVIGRREKKIEKRSCSYCQTNGMKSHVCTYRKEIKTNLRNKKKSKPKNSERKK